MAPKSNTNFKRILFQIAAFTFVMNTVAAFGACCVTTTPGDEVVENAAKPCHTPKTQDSADAEEDCCVMCLSMIPPVAAIYDTVVPAPSLDIGTNVSSTHSGIDPPFRPPIQ